MNKVSIEQINLERDLHREVLVQASGWAGWDCDDISGNHDLSRMFLAFEEDENLAGFGVCTPQVIEPHKLIIGAWSISPGVKSEFETGSELSAYIVDKNGQDMPGSTTSIFYVDADPLSAVVAQVKGPSLDLLAGGFYEQAA